MHKDYVGYANKTTLSMIDQLKPHPTSLNEENLRIRAAYFTPWSDAPDMNLGEYARMLDKRQRAVKKLRTVDPTFSPNLLPSKHPAHSLERTSNMADGWQDDGHEPTKHPMMDPTFSPTLLSSKHPVQALDRTSDTTDGWQNDGHNSTKHLTMYPTFSLTLLSSKHPAQALDRTSNAAERWQDIGHEPTKNLTMYPTFSPTLLSSKHPAQALDRKSHQELRPERPPRQSTGSSQRG